MDRDKEMIAAIHNILGQDITDAEIVQRIREVLYGKEEGNDQAGHVPAHGAD